MTIPVGFGQATIRFAGNGLPSDGAVVIGFENELSASASTCAGVIGDAWEAEVMPELTDDIALVEVLVKLGPDDTGPTGSVAYSVTGGVVGESAAPNTAILVKKITALGGRRGRGRMYIPGVDETKVGSDGRLDGTKLANLNIALTAFYVAINSGGCKMVLLHEPATIWVLEDGQPRRQATADPIPDPTEVDELEVQAAVATQRRRLRR